MRIPESVSTSLLLTFLLGLIVGLGVHALTYLGIDPREKIKTFWYALQLTSALAFMLALILLGRKEKAPDTSGFDNSLIVLTSCFGIFMAYAIFNFLFTGMVLNHDATPQVVNGQYVLFSHGAITKPLSAAEFVKHKIYEARMNSGHWMAFYLMAAGAMYKRMRQSENPSRQR